MKNDMLTNDEEKVTEISNDEISNGEIPTNEIKKRKRTYKICEHNKRISRCAECGGSELCEHKRLKSQCKECKGGSICEHNRIKSSCKECKGGNICEHNKVRGRCKDCNGSQICCHGRYKLSCVECDGTLICEHKKRRNVCALCLGSSVCQHGKVIYYCLECGGSQLCEHNIPRSRCFDCKGGSICIHNRIRCRCIECGGSQICEHKLNKQSCVECHGSQRCIHGKYINRCKECGGSILCKSEWCETVVHSQKYNGYCLRCCVHLFPDIPVSRNYKTKEATVVDKIRSSFPHYNWISDRTIIGGTSQRRPDIHLILETHVIIIEIDENKHTSYDCSCENKRLMELSYDVQHKPIVFIRFNPDAYKNSFGTRITSCWKVSKSGLITVVKADEWNERLHSLNEQIIYWLNNIPDKTVEIIELFY